MRRLIDARVIKQKKKRYEETYNWVAEFKSTFPGRRAKVKIVKGSGYRRAIHAEYALFRFLHRGFKKFHSTQELILATEHRGSVWAKEGKGLLADMIAFRKEPVSEPGDETYKAPPKSPNTRPRRALTDEERYPTLYKGIVVTRSRQVDGHDSPPKEERVRIGGQSFIVKDSGKEVALGWGSMDGGFEGGGDDFEV